MPRKKTTVCIKNLLNSVNGWGRNVYLIIFILVAHHDLILIKLIGLCQLFVKGLATRSPPVPPPSL